MRKYFKRVAGVGNGNYIYFWKYKGLSDENIITPVAIDYPLNLKLSHFGTKRCIEFNGSCSKQDKITHNRGKAVNIYIVCEMSKKYDISSYFYTGKLLVLAVSLTNADIDRYKYSGYGTGFDRKGLFSVSNGVGRNVIIFGVGMSSSPHIDNKKKRNFCSW